MAEEPKKLFSIRNFRWAVVELVYTFSNRPSFFARKRIESFVLFINAMILLDIWYIAMFKKIDYIASIAVFTAQMVYAGYQVTQIRKDMLTTDEGKKEKNDDLSLPITEDKNEN